MKTHEEVLRDIENMNNSERIKLLDKLFDRYYDNRPPKEVIEKEKIKSMWGKTNERTYRSNTLNKRILLMEVIT